MKFAVNVKSSLSKVYTYNLRPITIQKVICFNLTEIKAHN